MRCFISKILLSFKTRYIFSSFHKCKSNNLGLQTQCCFLAMFRSCPSGRGPVDKINSVSSNIPSNSSFSRATVTPEFVPLSLTYIHWSKPNLCTSLELNCSFKINTESAYLLWCITLCDSLAQT